MNAPPIPRHVARSYFVKARKRVRALEALFAEEAWSDVVREAQELVELAVKGGLRFVGVEPPKQRDVGSLLLQHRDRLPEALAAEAERLAAHEDFIPTEEYTRDDPAVALDDARWVVSLLDTFAQPQ